MLITHKRILSATFSMGVGPWALKYNDNAGDEGKILHL